MSTADLGGWGYIRQQKKLLNNSVVLDVLLYAQDLETLIPQAKISEVTFTVLSPGDDPESPTILNQPGSVIGDGHAQTVIAADNNDKPGKYRGFATFTYDEDNNAGLTTSVPCDYEIVDPFVRTGSSEVDGALAQCWLKLQDCFDSELGGPWLRDMTLDIFDESKIRGLVPEVLLSINQQMPYTDYTETSFPYGTNDGEAIMAQGLLVASVRHLMRSYTEQPDIMNSPVGFADRKRYQQAWLAIYQIEEPIYERWLNRWKLRQYDLTSAALLIGSKAGRMMPAPGRARGVGRGWAY